MRTDHPDEVERRKARERRLAEMGIGRHVGGRVGVYVGEVAAPSTRDQDFLADSLRVLEQSHPPTPAAGVDRAHHAGATSAEDNHVVLPHR